MSKMISVASGFQYSVNIGYDLNNDDKLKNFIPTRSALTLLEDILLSTDPASTDRARVLIGAYGKGKSHIVLTILAILMKRDLGLFKKMIPKLKENPKLYQCIVNYYDSENKILPIIITGSNTSLPQAFLLALQRTLSLNGLLNVMPETNYKAAVQVIKRWEKEFEETYKNLKKAIDIPIKKFIEELQNYSIEAYEKFEKIYPTLTAGSVFNPFLGFDVVDLYEEAVRGLKTKGYTGIYVIYDEFSKFLEANITEALVSDTKMLQDFAEKCNRSSELQMHLMLISHKEIANYIDKLPKQKVDGWRGVSDRFKHIHLNNNFTQTYEIITSAIQKKATLWNSLIFSKLEALYTRWDECEGEAMLLNFQAELHGYLEEKKIFFKNPAFSSEQEYRFVLVVDKDFKDNDELAVNFRVGTSGIITPYIEWKYTLNEKEKLFKQITLAPMIEPDIAKESFQRFLASSVYQNIEIRQSSIQVRF